VPLQASRFDSKRVVRDVGRETVARIRREHFVKGKTIKEIARTEGVRNRPQGPAIR